jgi:hypothetical protein
MPSVDLAYFAKREQEIQLAVQRSSPALIWSGEAGITVIAANKSRTQHRISKALDRLAIVTRGTVDSGRYLAKTAIYTAYAIASQRSRGDVHARQLAEGAGAVAAERYHAFLNSPVKAEAVIVQLQGTPEEDYLALVNYRGETHVHEKALFLGSVDRRSQNRREEEDNEDRLREQLLDAWNPEASLQEIGTIFRNLPVVQAHAELAASFADSTRLEVAFLDRRAFTERRFGEIFRRIS